MKKNLVVFVALSALGLFPAAPSRAKAASQDQNLGISEVFQARARKHVARAGAVPAGQTVDSFSWQTSNKDITQSGVALPSSGAAPDGLRAYNSAGASLDSNTMTATTTTGSGLTINPTFDSSILNNPNSAAILAMINQAIAIYQSLFSDRITVKILFRYSTTAPDGTPLGSDLLAESDFAVYTIPWNTFVNALRADATTGNDATANDSLPANRLSTNVDPSSANGRAVGLDTPTAMFANGTVATGGPYDGIVTLNSHGPFQFSRPPSGSNYDALRSTEHEIDEILGLGSHIGGDSDLDPQDLFSWSAPATRNITSTGSRYFSIDGGNTNIVDFNQDSGGDFGDWLSEDCPQENPYVQNAFACAGQFSDVTATSPEGINLDVIGYDLVLSNPTPTPSPSRLLNIATRVRVQTGDNVLIGGFIITGSDPKHLLLRAIGPSLTGFGVPDALADPLLELHGPGAFVTITNDNWRDDPAQEALILATGIPPTNDFESAIDATLSPGAYTALLSGKNGTTGIGSIEVYDLSQDANSMLANISTRGFVDAGDNVMIGGFIIGGGSGGAAARVIVRALGPSLPVAGALGDPTLDLRDSNGTPLGFNDDWRSDQQAEIIATGLPPTNDLESAIVQSLAPGAYTAIVRGYNNMTGVALVEAYQLQ